jgi:2-dehydropantoate 2-reductase
MSAIYVLGAGAIGISLAALLKATGREVYLLRSGLSSSAHPAKDQITGRIEISSGDIVDYSLPLHSISDMDRPGGPLIICTKTMGNRELAARLKLLSVDIPLLERPVILLQNGLHVEHPFVEAGFTELYRGVLFVTAQQLGEGCIRLKPVNGTAVGLVRGSKAQLLQTLKTIQVPHFDFHLEEDIQRVAWKKAMLNCVFNSVCPLLETDNGIFHRNETAMIIAREMLSEAQKVAAANGVDIGMEELESGLLAISRFSTGQEISTLQDIRAGRLTEIGSLNFELMRLANAADPVIPTPLLGLAGKLTELKSILNIEKHKNQSEWSKKTC